MLKLNKNSIVIGSIIISLCTIFLFFSLLKHKLPWVLKNDTKNSSIQWNDEHLDKAKTSIEQTGNKNSFPDVAPKVDSIVFRNEIIRVGSKYIINFLNEEDTVLVHDFINQSITSFYLRSYGWQEISLDSRKEKSYLVFETLRSLNPKSSMKTTKPSFFILFDDTVRYISVFLPSIDSEGGFGAEFEVKAFELPTDIGKNIMIVRKDVSPGYGHTESFTGFWKNKFDRFVQIDGPWGLIKDGDLPDTLKANKIFETIQSYHCLAYTLPLKFDVSGNTLIEATSEPAFRTSKHFDWTYWTYNDSISIHLYKTRNKSADTLRVLIKRTDNVYSKTLYFPKSRHPNVNEDTWLHLSIGHLSGWLNEKEFDLLGINNCD